MLHFALFDNEHRLTGTGVPRSYERPPPQDPTVALCLGTYMYGDPRGVGVSYARGTPVALHIFPQIADA